MMIPGRKKRDAFSFIEAIMTVTVISVMLVVAIPSRTTEFNYIRDARYREYTDSLHLGFNLYFLNQLSAIPGAQPWQQAWPYRLYDPFNYQYRLPGTTGTKPALRRTYVDLVTYDNGLKVYVCPANTTGTNPYTWLSTFTANWPRYNAADSAGRTSRMIKMCTASGAKFLSGENYDTYW